MSTRKFRENPNLKYHSSILHHYQQIIKHLNLSEEFKSKNLSQISFYILYDCDITYWSKSWSKALLKEIEEVKEYYEEHKKDIITLSPRGKKIYIDKDAYHLERHFKDSNYLEDTEKVNFSQSFNVNNSYRLNPRKFIKLYDNLYYDYTTNDFDYYRDVEYPYSLQFYDEFYDKAEEGKGRELIRKDMIYDQNKHKLPIKEYKLIEENHQNCNCSKCKLHTCYFPFWEFNSILIDNDWYYYSQKKSIGKNKKIFWIKDPESSSEESSFCSDISDDSSCLTGKRIDKIINQIKSDIKSDRFKLYLTNVTEEDLKPFYGLINLDDIQTYRKISYDVIEVGIFVNKDHDDPIRRKKVRDFAYKYFAYDLYAFHNNYDFKSFWYTNKLYNYFFNKEYKKNSQMIPNEINKVITKRKIFDETDERYKYVINEDLSFLNYSFDSTHPVYKYISMENKYFISMENESFINTKKTFSHEFGITTLYSSYITLKVKYPYLTQEELTLLDNYKIEAAFIFISYPYLYKECYGRNYDPFFNMLRILRDTQCNLNITEI